MCIKITICNFSIFFILFFIGYDSIYTHELMRFKDLSHVLYTHIIYTSKYFKYIKICHKHSYEQLSFARNRILNAIV